MIVIPSEILQKIYKIAYSTIKWKIIKQNDELFLILTHSVFVKEDR